MEKYLVEVYIPAGDQTIEIFIPQHILLSEAKKLIIDLANAISNEMYELDTRAILCHGRTGKPFDEHMSVFDSCIENGSKLVLI